MNVNEEPTISESTRLLPHVGSGDQNHCSRKGSSFMIKVTQCYRDLCIPSKAAVLIIISASVVGCLYYLVMGTTIALMDNPASYTHSISVNYSLPYALLAFVMIFYPLSGFIADVCCERRKIIMVSLCCLLLFLFILCFTGVPFLVLKMHYYNEYCGIISKQIWNFIAHTTTNLLVVLHHWSDRLSSQFHSAWFGSTF